MKDEQSKHSSVFALLVLHGESNSVSCRSLHCHCRLFCCCPKFWFECCGYHAPTQYAIVAFCRRNVCGNCSSIINNNSTGNILSYISGTVRFAFEIWVSLWTMKPIATVVWLCNLDIGSVWMLHGARRRCAILVIMG